MTTNHAATRHLLEELDGLDSRSGDQAHAVPSIGQRGRLEDEYRIYAAQAQALGWRVKTFDEWLAT